MKREFGIDNLRTLLTVLVVFHHVAIVYGGAGSWYWKEKTPVMLDLVLFNAVNQSFFMGMFFLFAGYFSRASIEKKGARSFIKDRFLRLGVPAFVYFFVISPLTNALANPADNLSYFQQVMITYRAREFEPGPLWFAEALLLFSMVIALIYKYSPAKIAPLTTVPRNEVLILMCCLVAAITFAVRLVFPAGKLFLWLQLGYFPMYILLFYFGFVAYSQRLLAAVTQQRVLFWLPVTIVGIVLFRIMITHLLEQGRFEGGLNIDALFYAIWEPFTSLGIIFLLLWFFNTHLNKITRLGVFLSRHAFAVYIVHPFFVVFVSLCLVDLQATTFIKLVMNGSISLALSGFCAWCLLKIPRFSSVL